MPVLAPGEAHALGVVVVNLDIRAVFGQLSADLPADIRLFLANAQGDWLIHPDSSKTFGFDRGRRILAQQDFPAVLPLVEGKLDQLVFQSPSPIDGVPMVAAFALFPLHIASSERGLILGLAQPLSAVLADVNRPRADLLGFALALALGCIVVAAVLAGAVTRPINAINQAARALAQGEADGLLPLGRSDEIGDLARTFHRMREQISRQVVTLQDHREELEHLAQHDPLTGLPNRRMLQERLDQSIARARRNNESVALLFVDLDRFKEINDRLGHDAGDYVLRVVARRMQGVLREIDTLARLGGDEFVVLLEAPAQGADGLGTVADKIIEQVRLPIPYGAQMLEVGASIGISQYPRDGHLATELIAAADRAMYQAKAEGRDRYKFATR
jgi:diguanylate cyclase (GGDEF)-like protein